VDFIPPEARNLGQHHLGFRLYRSTGAWLASLCVFTIATCRAGGQTDAPAASDVTSVARTIEATLGKIRDVRAAYRCRGLHQGENTYRECVWLWKPGRECRSWRDVRDGVLRREVAIAFNGHFSTTRDVQVIGDTGERSEGGSVREGRVMAMYDCPAPACVFMALWPPGTPLPVLLTGTKRWDTLYFPFVGIQKPMRIVAKGAGLGDSRCTIVEREPVGDEVGHKIWLDEQRGFMPVRIEIRMGDFVVKVYDGIRISTVGGHWFPTYARQQHRNRREENWTEGEMLVSEVLINSGIDDSAFTLSWPAGTAVADEIAGRGYYVGGGRARRPLEIVESLLK